MNATVSTQEPLSMPPMNTFSLPGPQVVGGMKILGDLQAPVMNAVWKRWEEEGRGSTVREVHEDLSEMGRAYQTIATVMSRLTEYGYLRARRTGSIYEYEPLITRADYGSRIVGPIIAQLKLTNPRELVEHLTNILTPAA